MQIIKVEEKILEINILIIMINILKLIILIIRVEEKIFKINIITMMNNSQILKILVEEHKIIRDKTEKEIMINSL